VVQLLLRGVPRRRLTAALVLAGVVLIWTPVWASRKSKEQRAEPGPPDLLMDGGRKLVWERSFDSEFEVKTKRSFWNKLVDAVAGQPEFHTLVRPYSIATDSHGRVIVTDPGAAGIHIFDFAQQKYKFIERKEKNKDPMLAPQCVALDAQDNIYVTDSDSGKIFVFDPNGKYERAVGSLKGGEGYFKRPTGIAVDSERQRIYVTDTLRNQVFVLDMQGSVVQTIGQTGDGQGEFNFPTELRLDRQNLMVVDAMNFRVQVFDLSGTFRYAIGKIGDGVGDIFRPKAAGTDSEGDIYVVDAVWSMVQVFNPEGQLLYYFGGKGTGAGEFQLPEGLFIDHDDRIFVVDSFNRRIQVFHYFGLKKPTQGGLQ
jgi:DNA-binding beta-propeller fold protein YncE